MKTAFAVLFAAGLAFTGIATEPARRVVVLVWDGMRPDFISTEHTPTLHQLARDGVMFANHHAVYCTATEVNGTALATGAYPANSGVIANREYRPALETNRPVNTQSLAVIQKGDGLTGGRYLLRPTVAETLRRAGKTTAIAGTKEVALLHDRREHSDHDCAGFMLFEGRSLPTNAVEPIRRRLGAFPPSASTTSGGPNSARDEWTTQALLSHIWSNGVPDFTLLWLSEPDFSQHATGPGSPKALAALASSDQNLAAVLAELEKRELRGQTDVFVVSDHGFSTVEQSTDVCKALKNAGFPAVREFTSPPKNGDILVVSQGASVLFYIVGQDRKTAGRLVEFLQQQEFAGVVFSRITFPGAFRLKDANVHSAHAPDVLLSLRWTSNSSAIGVPGTVWADGARNPGQGLHASLSRFDLHNTLVGAGPDLKKGFVNTLASGNTDLAPTILWLLGVKPEVKMDGRVLGEALTIKAPAAGKPKTKIIEASTRVGDWRWRQYLQTTRVGDTVYLDEGNGSQLPR
ncbi:MAG: alkaline phosphatase family protein [Verrucomicrobiota bacterium]